MYFRPTPKKFKAPAVLVTPRSATELFEEFDMQDFSTLPAADVQRFWSKVDRSGSCWLWTASTGRGYGRFGILVNGKTKIMKAHRIAYSLTNGRIPDGGEIDHRCRNRACVNAEHLRLATHKQNQENLGGAKTGSISGVRGVSWASRHNKWLAKITHNQRQVYVGMFATVAEAEQAVTAKRRELFTHNDADR